jgi:DNA/RNA-binding domain of Phe-tRNA-synthetase-like protein
VSDSELVAATGFVEEAIHAEFPGLRLCWCSVEARSRASPRPVKQRLRALSNRYHGASVVAMRSQPIPHAYRAFFRQIGLDPDATRIPSEEAAVSRLMHGGFRSAGIVSDALLIGLIETGVPVWALDAELVDAGGLGIRTTLEGETFGSPEVPLPLPGGRLVVADAQRIHALLFGEVAPGHEASSRSRRLVLFSLAVEGVPAIHVEEALWATVEVLTTG